MKFLRRFLIRFSNFTTGRRADQRVQEEMAEHLALQTEENLRAGMPPAEARRQAALKLGAAQAIREQHNASNTTPSKVFRLRRIFSSISAMRFACCTGLPDFP
jgi:hypothetical protein